MDTDPFHLGEREAQALASVQPAGASIRSLMPDQHRVFFAQLPLLLAGIADKAGWPVATALAGLPGFVSSPNPGVLHIAAVPDVADPAASGLRAGVPIGLLGIDFGTRRRNRANGTVTALGMDGITVSIMQSFGNCPQYIQTRDAGNAGQPTHPGSAECLARLDRAARATVAEADTLFVASGSGERGGEAGGMDVSHRGGRPGFVRVDGDVLTIPDFRGNRYFNTLGNLLLDPRVGLVFMDFATGDLLQLQGYAEIVWDGEEVRSFTGAERLWRVRVTAGWRRRAALPLRWTFRDYAPTTERTGAWNTEAAIE